MATPNVMSTLEPDPGMMTGFLADASTLKGWTKTPAHAEMASGPAHPFSTFDFPRRLLRPG
ncbi:protein of unknown function [Thermococcus nautili]|nr:protein of unknown function [Thermococcus nautili]